MRSHLCYHIFGGILKRIVNSFAKKWYINTWNDYIYIYHKSCLFYARLAGVCKHSMFDAARLRVLILLNIFKWKYLLVFEYFPSKCKSITAQLVTIRTGYQIHYSVSRFNTQLRQQFVLLFLIANTLLFPTCAEL